MATTMATVRRYALRGSLAGAAGYAAYSFLRPAPADPTGNARKIQRFDSLVHRGDDPKRIASRAAQLAALKRSSSSSAAAARDGGGGAPGEPFDLIIVGGGCTGAGAALDAATRGLRVACIERGDFSNETSSRSSKLIWGGFKYLQVVARRRGRRWPLCVVFSVLSFRDAFSSFSFSKYLQVVAVAVVDALSSSFFQS